MPYLEEYHRPASIEEALELLNRPDRRTVVLAGGSHLVAHMEAGVDAVVDLQALGLDKITAAAGGTHLEAMTTLQAIVDHLEVPPLVRQMARREGPNTFRNVGTIGGVVAGMQAESELYAALLVHQATVTLRSGRGRQHVDLANLNPEHLDGALITAVQFANEGESAAERVARTPADRPIVAVVGRRAPDGTTWLAACGVSTRPVIIEPESVARLDPPGDFRGSSTYRQALAVTLVQRVLDQLGQA